MAYVKSKKNRKKKTPVIENPIYVTPLFIRKRPAEKLHAVEKALGVSRSTLIEWLLHKQGLIDLEATHKDSPDIEILESAKDNPDVKTMIKKIYLKRGDYD
jgi:hypothetical protein